MKTFKQLKEQMTPEFIKNLCELAEGFEIGYSDIHRVDVVVYRQSVFELSTFYNMDIAFPLLLHRAVEGFNKKYDNDGISINGSFVLHDEVYFFSSYTSCHLTPCEMAILDCLIEVLK